MHEIERKFLVDGTKWKPSGSGTSIIQGYLSVEPERTVRVRTMGDKAFLAIKGKPKGLKRVEIEYAIPAPDAEILMKLCKYPPIIKKRYQEMHNNMIWEIDIFESNQKGLILAEVELESEEQEVIPPQWVKMEVSNDHRYFNSWLAQHPYTEYPGDYKE